MPGRLHIFQLGTHKGKYGEIRDYQVNYNNAGNTWTATLDEDKLKEFLAHNAVVEKDAADRALAELHRSGHTTLADIEIPESEAGAMGLIQQPSDA